MAKKKSTKKSGKGKDDAELDKKGKKAKAKAEKKQAEQQKKDAKARDGKGRVAKGKGAQKDQAVPEGGAAEEQAGEQTVRQSAGQQSGAAGAGAQPGAHGTLDQVGLLKLALRDTEAKLVAAEHRLHQVQQQLDDERRALAEATTPSIEAQEAVVDAAVAETIAEAIVDAAVVETVTEAVVEAELAAATSTRDQPLAADAAELAAATLENVAQAVDAALPAAGPASDDAGKHGTRSELTPPLPELGPESEPNESWTLVHLRKEAERRGISGVSNLPKSALIERLRA